MLINLCINIVRDIPGEKLKFFFEILNDAQKQIISTLLPLDLPTEISLSLSLSKEYWKRKCFEKQWAHMNYWISNCSWKNTFVSHSVEDLIDNFIAGKLSFPEVKSSLLLFQKCLYILKINGFKFNYSNDSHKNLPLEDHIFQLIPIFPNLKEIYLNNFPLNYEILFESNEDNFTDESYKLLSNTLSEIKNLTKFHLLGTQMKTSQFSCVVDSLITLNYLVNVDLSCNLITDEYCESVLKLLECSQLQNLKLSNNHMTSKTVKTLVSNLCENTSLKTLYLDRNSIEDEGAISIFNCLISNSNLIKIDLSYNQITSRSAFSLCILLERNNILQFLNLTGNNLEKDSIFVDLMKILKT
ncbi:transposable element Hobo transposase-complex-associated testis-expressed protein 1 [Nephila pilipes]|uniref:Transposable element Hobo transposase-complex-associated testis-expressed protein 1 n=1 Tax=Nephila pilipes TaxID=299642 RepID=A0A8X6R5N5_NEPPI|nr:transposable element Hobo transposase-complex-associated testis-expressed protein 1 [Nephila pilipes]